MPLKRSFKMLCRARISCTRFFRCQLTTWVLCVHLRRASSGTKLHNCKVRLCQCLITRCKAQPTKIYLPTTFQDSSFRLCWAHICFTIRSPIEMEILPPSLTISFVIAFYKRRHSQRAGELGSTTRNIAEAISRSRSEISLRGRRQVLARTCCMARGLASMLGQYSCRQSTPSLFYKDDRRLWQFLHLTLFCCIGIVTPG